MRKCPQCGGRLRRVHRTFWERFQFLAIYSCKDCRNCEFVPHHYRMHFGAFACCPRCGTYRITKLKEPDKIDPMERGIMNWFERHAGGRLFHCRYCRIQFYDRRKLPTEKDAAPPVEDSAAEAQGKAGGEIQ